MFGSYICTLAFLRTDRLSTMIVSVFGAKNPLVCAHTGHICVRANYLTLPNRKTKVCILEYWFSYHSNVGVVVYITRMYCKRHARFADRNK